MKRTTPLALALVLAILFACLAYGLEDSSSAPADNPFREPARAVLLASECATCHEGTRVTAQARALAVYDLTADRWHATMSEKQLRGFLERLTPFAADEQQLLRSFVSCALDGDCEAAAD